MGAVFRQSLLDFPCPVALGHNTPSFSLHRFKPGLRFIPPNDEGYTMRGDRRRLVYKGRRQSHRFTILNDTAFEYDCILEREPDSNVIALYLEGAENFDFFRQPDFVPDDFLKGSYAVYKKDTLIGEGTGKLCHIHRPQIIDARGRRCWGELSVVGNELCIKIPEWFLSGAKYPVIVDPTIGTTQIGSQRPILYTTEHRNALIAYTYGANKFLVPDQLAGTCTAYFYFNQDYLTNRDITPLLFDNINEKPKYRRSQNEEYIDIYQLNEGIGNNPLYNPPCWKSATFNVIDTVQGGSYIWFGAYSRWFITNFDYGGIYYKNFPETITVQEEEYYYDEEEEEWICLQEGEYYDAPDFFIDGKEQVFNYILSWYFNYTSQGQNYVRTLTQGVSLTDSRILSVGYERKTTQMVQANSTLSRQLSIYKKVIEALNVFGQNSFLLSKIRKIQEGINIADTKSLFNNYIRSLFGIARAGSEAKKEFLFFRKLYDSAQANEAVNKLLAILRRLREALNLTDNNSVLISKIRKIQEALNIADTISHINSYIRNLFSLAVVGSETKQGRLLFRILYDNLQVNSALVKLLAILRRIQEALNIFDNNFVLISRIRKIQENIHIVDTISRLNDFIRGIFEAVGVRSEAFQEHILFRKVYDFVLANSAFDKMLSFIKKLREIVQGSGNNSRTLSMARKIQEGIEIDDKIGNLGGFIRGLFDTVEAGSKIKQGIAFSRQLDDTARAVAVLFRNLFLVVRIATGAFIRDIILGRFLIAKTELSLKSCIVREIVLDSRIGNEE